MRQSDIDMKFQDPSLMEAATSLLAEGKGRAELTGWQVPRKQPVPSSHLRLARNSLALGERNPDCTSHWTLAYPREFSRAFFSPFKRPTPRIPHHRPPQLNRPPGVNRIPSADLTNRAVPYLRLPTTLVPPLRCSSQWPRPWHSSAPCSARRRCASPPADSRAPPPRRPPPPPRTLLPRPRTLLLRPRTRLRRDSRGSPVRLVLLWPALPGVSPALSEG